MTARGCLPEWYRISPLPFLGVAVFVFVFLGNSPSISHWKKLFFLLLGFRCGLPDFFLKAATPFLPLFFRRAFFFFFFFHCFFFFFGPLLPFGQLRFFGFLGFFGRQFLFFFGFLGFFFGGLFGFEDVFL